MATAAGTPLKEGMEIFCINGLTLRGRNVQEVSIIVQYISGSITISAFKNKEDDESSGDVVLADAAA